MNSLVSMKLLANKQKADIKPTQETPSSKKLQKGLEAEKRVTEALQQKGLFIQASRIKIRGVEVDLIAYEKCSAEAWIVEVKTCSKNFEYFISEQQKKRQRMVLQSCIERYPRYKWRAVLALVYPERIDWIWDYLT